jgi:hypothetical protein
MKAKEFLLKVRILNNMIENKLMEKAQWKSIAIGITPQYGGERVQTSGSKQKMADAVGRYLDMEREIDACIDRHVDAKKEVIAVIEQLKNPTEYDLLHKVYIGIVDHESGKTIKYMTLDEVADLYDKSHSWATTVHGRALQHVQEILDERVNENGNH